MTEITVLLLIAATGFGIARRFQIPVIPFFLFGGITVSVFVTEENQIDLQRALELGLTFLVFASGVELNPQRFGRQKRAVIWVGLIQFATAGFIGFVAARMLGFDAKPALYLAFTLSTSSTLVVVRLLSQGRQMAEPFGRLVVGVLLFQDILMILLIIVVARVPHGAIAVTRGIAATAILGALALASQRWFVPWFALRHKLESELLLLVVLAQLFLFTGLADLLELPSIAGAFAAGLSLSSFPVNGIVRALLSSLTDFFLAIFFTALGAFVGIPNDPIILMKGILLGLILVAVTPPIVTAIAEAFGLSSRNAIEAGVLLAQSSEFSLVLGITGHITLSDISRDVLSVIAWVAAFTMTLTPLMANDRMTRWLLRFHPDRRQSRPKVDQRDHILVLGFGTGGMWVVKPLIAAGHSVLVVDDDPVVIEHLNQAKIPCLRGDGSDIRVLQQAGAEKAKLIISSMRRPNEADTILQNIHQTPIIVRVFEESDAAQIKRQGGIPIMNSEASAEKFIEWFDKTGRAAVSRTD
ncbi:MAG: Glutathione-regulated potassium-efflux system protein KefC [Verrucomicrobia subdivision 3 bacterium]|nr:Glutathione-regulated potassium-efflux system protein KefC [Limisphaerales bacterium]MCS1414101.1 Glutathione-regulated potassium-efflux system protein KefC [Limisphaerales bacterium]